MMLPKAESEDKVTFDEKLRLEQRLAEQIPAMEAAWEKEKTQKEPKLEVKHAYAYVLCKSGSESHKTLGIRLMQELVSAKWNVEDCLYSVAEAYYGMGKYSESRTAVETVLRRNPDHRYSTELHAYLKEAKAQEDMVVGAVTAGGVLFGVGAVVLGLMLARPRK